MSVHQNTTDTGSSTRKPAAQDVFLVEPASDFTVLKAAEMARDTAIKLVDLTHKMYDTEMTGPTGLVRDLALNMDNFIDGLDNCPITDRDSAALGASALSFGLAWRKMADGDLECAMDHLTWGAESLAVILMDVWPTKAGAVIH